MRRWISILLSLSFTLTPAAYGQSGPAGLRAAEAADTAVYFHSVEELTTRAHSVAPGRPTDLKEIRKRIASGSREALFAPAKALPHISQTLMMLWILGGVEAVRQDYEMQPLQAT